MFKIGDLVQVKDRAWVTKNYGSDGSKRDLFLGPMEIIGFKDHFPGIFGTGGSAEFAYPKSFGITITYYWPLDDLELIQIQSGHCQCPITLLMNRGCQCGATI